MCVCVCVCIYIYIYIHMYVYIYSFLESVQTIEKINEAKSLFFENIKKIDKLLAKLIKKKRRIQINKIRN